MELKDVFSQIDKIPSKHPIWCLQDEWNLFPIDILLQSTCPNMSCQRTQDGIGMHYSAMDESPSSSASFMELPDESVEQVRHPKAEVEVPPPPPDIEPNGKLFEEHGGYHMVKEIHRY